MKLREEEKKPGNYTPPIVVENILPYSLLLRHLVRWCQRVIRVCLKMFKCVCFLRKQTHLHQYVILGDM